MKLDYVFVYGTLKTPYGNNALLQSATLVGRAQTEQADYTLVDLGAFPAVHFGGKEAIIGELYTDIDALTAENLDRLEGYPNFYDRKEVDVRSENGELVKAWMYFFDGEPSYPVVEGGEWVRKARGY